VIRKSLTGVLNTERSAGNNWSKMLIEVWVGWQPTIAGEPAGEAQHGPAARVAVCFGLTWQKAASSPGRASVGVSAHKTVAARAGLVNYSIVLPNRQHVYPTWVPTSLYKKCG
jgi:hypothetical protein